MCCDCGVYRADVPAARRELVSAQRLRPLMTYAMPYFGVQARIELARVYLALADLAGAYTVMRESRNCSGAGLASGPSPGRPGRCGPSSPCSAEGAPQRHRR